jgi:predicted phage-related endonuclease
VPQAYLFQVQHYMAVTGYPVADIAVLIGGSDFRIYTVEADRELHDMLVTAEAAFWQRVQNNEPPEPVSLADALAMWGKASVSRSVQATPEMVAAVVEMRNLKAQIAELDARADESKAEIMIALGEADTLVDFNGTPLVTWKAGKPPERFDAKTFKVAHPELYAAFAATGEPTRRFLLK